MRIKVGRDDQFAQEFVFNFLEGKKNKVDGQGIEYKLVGGGEREVVVFSLSRAEMGKKRFALRVGECDHPLPFWSVGIEDAVILILNRDSQKELGREVTNILGMLDRLTKSWISPKEIRGRGGAVVFEHLVPTGRVIIKRELLKDLTGNQVFRELTGCAGPVVTYGTTDAANVFELIQTLKAAWYLGLPMVFDNYESAHNVGDYWQRVFVPSLKIFGNDLDPADLGLEASGKFTQIVDQQVLRAGFKKAGLASVANLANQLPKGDISFAQWYRLGMQEVTTRVLRVLNVHVEFRLVATEQELQYAPFWNISLTKYAANLQERLDHPVIALHKPDGGPIKSDEFHRLPSLTVAEAHQRGWWLSGAGIYWGMYSLGKFGGLVITVKDSKAGLVQLLAKPYLEDSKSGLFLLPVGLFRLTSKGQHADWSIDPWVFLELLERWGSAKSRNLIHEVWEVIEVPLAREHIGYKTVATVSLNGIEINTKRD